MSLPTFTSLGSGPTVLMLHGLEGGHLAFAPQVESLALAGYRAVAWDMPGYGLSPPIEPYGFKGLAGRCIALIEALQCGTVTLVGQDMGGMVAQEVVARRPELVDRLVLCASSASASDPVQRQALDHRLARLDEGDDDMALLADRLLPAMVGPQALPEGVRLARHCLGLVHAATYRRAVEAAAGFDRSADLARIAVPTLLLSGGEDAGAPAMRALARRIASSTLRELPGIGHLPNLEAPDDFDAALLAFLALPRMLH